MNDALERHLEKALAHYSQDKYYDIMLKAKDLYLQLTGSVDDSEQDYENKMNCFNDWYLFQYRLPDQKHTVMEDYLQSYSPDETIAQAFRNFCHSLFQYLGKSFRGYFYVKDIWSKKKLILGKESPLPLLKNDFFIDELFPFPMNATS